MLRPVPTGKGFKSSKAVSIGLQGFSHELISETVNIVNKLSIQAQNRKGKDTEFPRKLIPILRQQPKTCSRWRCISQLILQQTSNFQLVKAFSGLF